MKVIAIIQARMGSSRLPNKVMMDIEGKPVLCHIINRLHFSKMINRIIIATTTSPSDDAIAKFASDNGVEFFRGSENDVLDRYYQTAKYIGAGSSDAVIRITGDCPLIDPEVVDKVVELYKTSNADYVSNINPPTFPDGLDTEVFKFEMLEKAWKDAKMMSEREHVTLYIRNHPEIFYMENLNNHKDYSNLRWTVDEKEDLEVVKVIYENLYSKGKPFLMEDILNLLEKNSSIQEKNKKFIRNEGLIKSLMNDREI